MDLNQAIADGTFNEVMDIASEILNEPREIINAGTILPPDLKCCVCSQLVKRKRFTIDCKQNNCYNCQANEDIYIASLVKNNLTPPK